MKNKWRKYCGILNERKMPRDVRAAYVSWLNQRRRCYDKTHKQYAYYGAKGIEVKYESRDFIGWWISNLKTFKGEIPTVGRIDHAGHYCFENIELQSKSDNSKEMNIRRRLAHKVEKKKPVRMLCYACDSKIADFKSVQEASAQTGIHMSIISGIANGRHRRTHEGYSFSFIMGEMGGDGKSLRYRKKRGEQSSCS